MRSVKLIRPKLMNDTTSKNDGLPLVGEDQGNRPLWIGLTGIALAGVVLFYLIESNRQSVAQPQIASARDYAIASAPRDELFLPPDYSEFAKSNTPQSLAPIQDAQPKQPPVRLIRQFPPSENAFPAPSLPPQNYSPQPPDLPVPIDPGRAAPTIVHDIAPSNAPPAGVTSSATSQATRAAAVPGGDRSLLVSQGTLIAAVLETAIDSTQSGQVRAMISKNVFNGNGTKILIPKGSRVFGEYKGELGPGQNRAQIIWTRLIRPDGATISLDSPASDPLGRAGVKGRVNTHFGERLLGALLQSTIDFGALAASRAISSNNGVIVAIPSAAQGATSQIVQPAPKPTLKVRHGTRISVLVARDLDFSAVD